MHLDAVVLARIQFAFTIMFHYLFPPLSIGLGGLLVIMEGLYLKTKNPIFESMTRFWTKVFAINFSIGVASGIVMEFQFGTNWAGYSNYVGDVFGAALAAEGIFAFFLESGFLAVLLFGWERVSPKVHFFSTLMVALGATFSALWINIANSWQQTPAGYHLVQHGAFTRAEVTNFWEVVFNPSALPRFTHAVLGGWVQAAFFIMSIAAFYLLRKQHTEFAKKSLMIGLITAAIALPLQFLVGSHQAEIVAEYQPAKLSAFEGHFHTAKNAPLYAMGIPDVKNGKVDYAIALPGMLSFLAKHDRNAEIKGWYDFPKTDRPPVEVPFYSFHLMVGLGILMLIVSWFSLGLLWMKKLYEQRWLLWVLVASVVIPYLANQMGWVAAEVGRQPWIVYNLLRTSQATSRIVTSGHISISLGMFVLIYGLLFVLFLYSLDRKIRKGPELVLVLAGATAQMEPGTEAWMSLTGERNDPADRTDMIEED